MISNLKFLLASGSFKKLNTNHHLNNFVIEGLSSLIGSENVHYSEFENIIKKLDLIKPNFLLIFGSIMPDSSNFADIKSKCNKINCKLIFWLHDDPYEFDASKKINLIADFIFTNDKYTSNFYNRTNVYHLPLAASPTFHYRPLNETKNVDIMFCGVAFSNRLRIIKDLHPILDKYKTIIKGDGWPQDIKYFQNKRIKSDDLVSLYSSSLVTLNMGRHLNLANEKYLLDASTPGPRTFEAAMAGTVQFFFVESLEITDYFKKDSEIIFFDSPKSFKSQFEKIFETRNLAMSIAKNAQNRALLDHTYAIRLNKMISLVNLN